MAFRPLNDQVVVRASEVEEKTAGGIIIPDSAKDKPTLGEVVAVGPGKYSQDGTRLALDVKVGDRVLFKQWSATEYKIEGEDLLILDESGIVGVIS
tara:strand:+ start:711 stop:998 length:288 start_codon:yes stop_codon:yes gene_type:complete